ncbi:MAG TPA: AEC family transporter [Polyangiaceae bacterium]|nr:AEC family transporter [Polyangiaceae bacterium]
MDAAFALILVSLVAGFVLARLRVLAPDAADTLNRFVIYVCLPALVLRLVPKLRVESGLALLAITPWLLLAVGVAVVLAASRIFRFSRQVEGALLLCVPLGNTSFLGFPMIGALVSAEAVRLAVVYDQAGSFLILSTYGLFVVARYSGDGKPSVGAVVLRIIRFPPFIALLAAFLPLRHPPWLDGVLQRLGEALVPVAMCAVGLTLRLRPPREPLAFALGLSTKLLLFPFVVYVACAAVGAHGPAARVAVLESGMPPMITAGALATMAGLAPELVAALVGYGVLLALATLPFIAAHVR